MLLAVNNGCHNIVIAEINLTTAGSLPVIYRIFLMFISVCLSSRKTGIKLVVGRIRVFVCKIY